MPTRSFDSSFADTNGVVCFEAKLARPLCSMIPSPPNGSLMSLDSSHTHPRHPDTRPPFRAIKLCFENGLENGYPSYRRLKCDCLRSRRLFRLLYLTIKSIVTHTRSGYVPSITINAYKLGQSMGGSPGSAANPCLA